MCTGLQILCLKENIEQARAKFQGYTCDPKMSLFIFFLLLILVIFPCSIKMHENRNTKKKNDEKTPKGAVPAYLLDREGQSRAKVLSNMIKQKRKEKAVSNCVKIQILIITSDDDLVVLLMLRCLAAYKQSLNIVQNLKPRVTEQSRTK